MGTSWAVRKILRQQPTTIPIQKASARDLWPANLSNPSAVDYLTLELPTLISEISVEQQRIVQNILLKGITQGRDAAQIAREIRDSVGLTEQQSQWVSNFREQLESGEDGNFTPVDERRLSAVDSDAAQAEFDAETTDQATVDGLVNKYTSSLVNYRALTIAVSEIHAASIQGQDDIWKQAVEQGYLNPDITRRHWLGVGDEKERDEHVQTQEMNEPDGVALDEPFQTPIGEVMNPGESGDDAFDDCCRCCVFLSFADQWGTGAVKADPEQDEESPEE